MKLSVGYKVTWRVSKEVPWLGIIISLFERSGDKIQDISRA